MICGKESCFTYFDVDDTILIWDQSLDHPDGFYIDDIFVVPHKKHIEQLKKHKARDHTIVVWSAGGANWAKKAVELLQLEPYVDFVLAKPSWFYDDKKPDEFMNEINRVYYPLENNDTINPSKKD